MVVGETAISPALHADERVVAERCGNVVLSDRAKSRAARYIHERFGTPRGDQVIRGDPQSRTRATFSVVQERRIDPRRRGARKRSRPSVIEFSGRDTSMIRTKYSPRTHVQCEFENARDPKYSDYALGVRCVYEPKG